MRTMLIALAAMTVLIATRADAQIFQSGRNVTNPDGRSGASRTGRNVNPRRDPDAVYADGKLIGRDPDPNVRLMIRRQYENQSY